LDFTILKDPKKVEDLTAALEYVSDDMKFQFETFLFLKRTRQREEILSLFFAAAPALIVTLSHDQRITMCEGNALQDQKTFHSELIGEKASRARKQHPELEPILNNLILRQEETLDLRLGDRIVRTWFYRRKLDILNEIDMIALGLDITDQHEISIQNKKLAGHLQQLAHELLTDESRDRRKLAQQVHDQIGHQLAMLLVKMDLESANAPEPIKDIIQTFRSPVQETLNESRSLSNDISPPILYKLGLLPAIEWFAEKTSEQTEIPIRVEGERIQDVDDEHKALCYQIITELVINAVKHAEADEITIRVSSEASTLTFSVEDDGKGMPVTYKEMKPESSQSGGFGLFSIEQRLAYLGGSVVMKSNKGKGTLFEIILPINGYLENHNEPR
jgi:signal transduction histidine kinase